MLPQRKFIISGIIGCLCFGIGDWLLGYVDPALIEGYVFYFIRAGHGADYSTSKAAMALVLAVVGMCFLYPGFIHISDITKDEKTKRFLGYVFGLCSVGWLIIHFIVAVNVIVFSQAEKNGSRKLAITLSNCLGSAGMAALCCAYLFVAFAFIKLIADIIRQKTYLKRSEAFFTPILPMTILSIISQVLPQSPFSYGLFTFCMNGGMLVWFVYLLTKDRKTNRISETEA